MQNSHRHILSHQNISTEIITIDPLECQDLFGLNQSLLDMHMKSGSYVESHRDCRRGGDMTGTALFHLKVLNIQHLSQHVEAEYNLLHFALWKPL